MRFHSQSRLTRDYYFKLVYETILKSQNPISGLIASAENDDHAVVRDNLYSIICIWALSLAYKKSSDVDEDRIKHFELQQATVKCMRGLLMAMMRQRDKIVRFQESFSVTDSIHAKFSSKTGLPIVGDSDWGHLQIDAISLYILTLAQITASGVQVVFTLEEVALVQNLVFYIECAYCTPDFGIWGRGDKTNTGIPELNASSIGMAKAALEAITDLDLFGAQGGSVSVIHVMSDETQKNKAILMSMLPRESLSKETDSALLTVIGYPAFAVENPVVIEKTINSIVEKLGGHYGFKRFLRDGYKTPLEDPNRLHYESWELQVFEGIECQWPLFFCYMIINECFREDVPTDSMYSEMLENVLIKTSDGLRLIPELYSVSNDKLEAERWEPGSQVRQRGGLIPFHWAQSLYILARLLREKFIVCGEIDPMNRRHNAVSKPDTIVQVVVLTKDPEIQSILKGHGIEIKTLNEVAPYEVYPARVLSYLYKFLGRNEKLGLPGRKSRDMGILDTSKFYRIHKKICAFTPQRLDLTRNYMDCDTNLLMITLEYILSYLSTSWFSLGRPLLTITLEDSILENGMLPDSVLVTMKKLKSGLFINGTRVIFGDFDDFISTSCICNLDFVGYAEDGCHERIEERLEDIFNYVKEGCLVSDNNGIVISPSLIKSKLCVPVKDRQRRLSMKGTIKRSRSLLGSHDSTRPRMTARVDTTSNASEEPNDVDVEVRLSVSRQRAISEIQFDQHDFDEWLSILAQSENLVEEGDILHYLATTYGLDCETNISQNGKIVRIRDLLNSLYEKAIQKRSWGIVRHSAGLLGKKVEDLSKNVTDLLVCQKQVTVGLPPNDEITISRPHSDNELRKLISKAFKGDASTSMLAKELFSYLAMFINTEPHIFHGILRIRVGLIIQVLTSEIRDRLQLQNDEAYEQLMSLSPFEMRNLLHHTMASKDFIIEKKKSGYCIYIQEDTRLSQGLLQQSFKEECHLPKEDAKESDESDEEEGMWIRRRRLDGALNRVPNGFYSKIWHLLQICREIRIGDLSPLCTSITQEMTSGELKFALAVESFLNSVSFPEYRQLFVEALIILTLAQERGFAPTLGNSINLKEIVDTANRLFLIDQFYIGGDATQCCAKRADGFVESNPCLGAANICQVFYDSAPSGSYGTMQYMIKAACKVLDTLPKDGTIDCNLM